MHSLVAAGSVEVPEDNLAGLESRIGEICIEAGFPAGEEFKWSPGSELWMRDNLVRDRRRDFYMQILTSAKEAGACATIVIEDIAHARATGNCSAETDVTRLLLERAHLSIPEGHFGMFIADRPGGGRGDEDKFISQCLDTLKSGTNVVGDLRKIALAITTSSKFIRLLQLADVITGCTTAYVAGETRFAPVVFLEGIKPLLRSESGRIGGVGLKIHPDGRFANLYHWLLGDQYFVRSNVGRPFPLQNSPYVASADVFK